MLAHCAKKKSLVFFLIYLPNKIKENKKRKMEKQRKTFLVHRVPKKKIRINLCSIKKPFIQTNKQNTEHRTKKNGINAR